MDLKVVHDTIRFYLRKGQNSYFAPEEIDSVINRAQIDHFEEMKPPFAANQQVNDALSPFRTSFSFSTSDTTSGVLTLPTNYFHLLSVSLPFIDAQGRNRYQALEFVDETEVDTRRDSALIPVTVYNPIGLYTGGRTIQIYPDIPYAGKAYYLRKPADCVFGYSQSGRTITYNSGSSTQLEWNDAAIEKIIYKALALLGLNTQDIPAMQFGEAKGAA